MGAIFLIIGSQHYCRDAECTADTLRFAGSLAAGDLARKKSQTYAARRLLRFSSRYDYCPAAGRPIFFHLSALSHSGRQTLPLSRDTDFTIHFRRYSAFRASSRAATV